MRGVIAAVVCLAGCDQVLGLDRESPGVVLAGFDQRKPIRIISEALTPLTDFPVALILKDDPDLVAGVKDGRDFAVTDAIGNVLDIDLETFDPGDGDLVLWTRVPTLAANRETLVYLYYGGEPQVVDRPGTWPTDYAAVWHLGGAAITEMDSTRARLALVADTSVPAAGDGVAGGARTFNGTSNRMQAVDVDALDAGDASFSNSIWVLCTGAGTSADMALNKGGAAANVPGYDYELGSGGWQAQVADGDTKIILDLGDDTLIGTWHHLATVVDRELGFARAYLDGNMVTELPLVDFASMSNTGLLRIGGHVPFVGQIDEVRIYHGALSDDWIATEHRNLRAPTSFLLVGDAETLR